MESRGVIQDKESIFQPSFLKTEIIDGAISFEFSVDIDSDKLEGRRTEYAKYFVEKINEELETPQDNQHMMWVREKLAQSRWLASKLANNTFGDKIKQEVKQDSKLIIQWDIPENENNLIQAKEIVEEVPKTPIQELSNK